MRPDPALVAAVLAAAGGAPAPAGARRLVRLDLPPLRDIAAEAPWLVVNPATGDAMVVPIEIHGDGLRLWHERAHALALEPGAVAWVVPPLG